MTGATEEGIVRGLIGRYLEAREVWERRAHREFEAALVSGRNREVMTASESEFRQLAREYFDIEAVARLEPVAFGDPPSVEARSTRIVSVDISHPDRAIVQTVERSDGPGGKSPFEYDVRKRGDRWALLDRRTRDSSDRWIRHLL